MDMETLLRSNRSLTAAGKLSTGEALKDATVSSPGSKENLRPPANEVSIFMRGFFFEKRPDVFVVSLELVMPRAVFSTLLDCPVVLRVKTLARRGFDTFGSLSDD
jgi:hypothetical protein